MSRGTPKASTEPPEFQDDLGPEAETTIAPPPKKRTTSGKKKAGADDVNESEAQQDFYLLFKLLSRLLNSDADFTAKDFAGDAKIYVNLCRRWPVLRYITVFIQPFTFIGSMVDKFSHVMRSRPPKPGEETPASQMTVDHPFNPV